MAVTLSEAQDRFVRRARPFAALRVTGLDLAVGEELSSAFEPCLIYHEHGELGVHPKVRKKSIISPNTTGTMRIRLRYPSTRPKRARRCPRSPVAVFLA